MPWSSSQAKLGSHPFSVTSCNKEHGFNTTLSLGPDELWTQENVHGGWRTLWSWCAHRRERDDLMEQGTREGAGRRARMTETCSEGRESTRDRQQIKFWTPLQESKSQGTHILWDPVIPFLGTESKERILTEPKTYHQTMTKMNSFTG